MTDICNMCGLPEDLCVCEQINTQQRKIYIVERRVRGSKFVTTISGIENQKEVDQMYNELKKELACGGTSKKGVIELQGKHRKKAIVLLLKKGYTEDQIS